MQMVADRYDFCVRWKPYLLRPNMPKEGLMKDASRVFPQIIAAGEEVGIEFTGKSAVYPNTIQAHILLEFVEEDQKTQNLLAETLFKTYFTDGGIPDEDTLLRIAKDYELDTEKVSKVIRDQEKQEAILQKTFDYHKQGVTGVPFFYMNGQRTFSGAQEPEAFVKMFEVITEKFPLKKPVAEAADPSSNL